MYTWWKLVPLGDMIYSCQTDSSEPQSAKDNCCVSYGKLARMAAESGERLWALRPKLHAPRLCSILFYRYIYMYMFHMHAICELRDGRKYPRWLYSMVSRMHIQRKHVFIGLWCVCLCVCEHVCCTTCLRPQPEVLPHIS